MTTTLQPQDRERVAGRLLRSSERHSYDPVVDLDWTTPLDPALPAMPLHRVSLYGTPLWESLDERQRVLLSWHEMGEHHQRRPLVRDHPDAGPAAVRLRPGPADRARAVRPDRGRRRDPARGDVRPGRRRCSAPGARYRPASPAAPLGRLFKTIAARPALFAPTLVAEETLDRLQREMRRRGRPAAADPGGVAGSTSRRRPGTSRTPGRRCCARRRKLGRAELARHRHVAAIAGLLIVDGFVDPAVYRSVDLDPATAVAQARGNAYRRETRRWMGEKVTTFLSEAGMIGGPSTALWRRAGLIG